MKNSPEPQEPEKWASGLSEPDSVTGQDAEIQANEDLLLEALGRPEDRSSSVAKADGDASDVSPRPEFQAQLRAKFLGASSASSTSSSSEAPQDEAMEKLRGWVPEPPRAEFRAQLREAFLNVEATSVAPSTEAEVDESIPSIARHRSRSAGPRSTSGRARTSTRGRSASPAPASPNRFRLVAAGGLLAAAAAVLLILQRPDENVAPQANPESDSTLVAQAGDPQAGDPVDGDGVTGNGETSGQGIEGPADATTAPSGWELDTSFGDEAALLASIRIDGESVESMGEFQSQIAGAQRIESVGGELRIRHRDEFVMELAADTAVRLDAWGEAVASGADSGTPRVLFAESGSLRVATGPGFDPALSLVVETPHVRTEVVGTVFGLDIGADYTCVCCLEGSVRTQSTIEGTPEGLVPAGRTWVANATEHSRSQIPLVHSHRTPLERLEGYWS